MEPLEPLVTADDLATEWAVSSETVLRWARLGFIPSISMPGRVVRFRRSEVVAAIPGLAAAESAA